MYFTKYIIKDGIMNRIPDILSCVRNSFVTMSGIQMYCNVDFQAKLAASFAPSVVKIGKIFDVDERKYREMGLHFRHTDNINYFLTAAKFVGLPQVIGSKLFCAVGARIMNI